MPLRPHGSPSASSASTPSELLRTRGNILYKQALGGGFCATIQRGRLGQALRLYQEALRASLTVDEKASCYKNLGMVRWLFCKFELNQLLVQAQNRGKGKLNVSTEGLSACKLYLFGAVESLSEARKHGAEAKTEAWLLHLQNILKDMIEWASEQTSLLCLPRSPLLQYVANALERGCTIPTKLKLLAYRSYVAALFKEALCKRLPDDSMDYKGCESLLHDCSMSLRKVSSSCSVADPDEESRSLLHEIQELQNSVNVHMCICEAMQVIALGDLCLSEALSDDEYMDMEKVKDSLAYYRQASLATHELDMESEAVAMSRIGKVYSTVLKLPEQGNKYHYQAVRLALTVMSPSIERADWYQYSLAEVKAHQEKVAANEKEKHEKDRASSPVIHRLTEEIAALDRAAEKGAEAVLKHVYTEHPHPDPRKNAVPVFVTKAAVKASLKKAILHYHPDSNVQGGDSWKVLCGEIVKRLTQIYGCLK